MLRRFKRRARLPGFWTPTPLQTTRLILVPLETDRRVLYDEESILYWVLERDTETRIGTAAFAPAQMGDKSWSSVIDWILTPEMYNRGYSTEVLDVLTEESFVSVGVPVSFVGASPTSPNPAKGTTAIVSGFSPAFTQHDTIFYRKLRP